MEITADRLIFVGAIVPKVRLSPSPIPLRQRRIILECRVIAQVANIGVDGYELASG